MPAAVAGFFVATVGLSAGVAAIATGILIGAAVGALIGGVTAALKGGDILKGALMGAVFGGITGGIGAGLGLATGLLGAGAPAAGAGVSEAALIGVAETGIAIPATTAAGPTIAGAGGVIPGPISGGTGTLAGGAGATSALSKAAGWIGANPEVAKVGAAAIGGGAKGILEGQSKQKELDALMERDRLNREAKQIRGLTLVELKTVLPSIGKFTETPAWVMPEAGLLGKKVQANA